MFVQKGLFSSIGRTVLATVAAVALTAVEPSLALAGSAPTGVSAQTGTSGATDFSSRGRRYGGGAAAAAAFAGIVGTGIAIAATQNRGYYDDGYYGGGPVYYGGGPGYYGDSYGYFGGGPYYGGGGHYGFQYGRGYRNTFPTP
jgi:hypothetical protein